MLAGNKAWPNRRGVEASIDFHLTTFLKGQFANSLTKTTDLQDGWGAWALTDLRIVGRGHMSACNFTVMILKTSFN